MQRSDRVRSAHQMVVAALLILAPLLGAKVTTTFGFNWTTSLLAVALVYAVLDVINELWGPREASFTIIVGSVVRVVLFLTLVPIALALPTYLAPEGYGDVIELAARVFIAGELAVLLGNLLFDIPLFARLKRREVGGFFLRTNVSNLVSNLLSAALFVLVAFWGTPVATWRLFVGQVLVRYLLSVVLSPFTTLWVRYLRGRVGAG